MTTPTDTASTPTTHDDPTDTSPAASTAMPTDEPTQLSASGFGTAQQSAAGQPGATHPQDGTTTGTGAPGTPWPGAATSAPYQSWTPWVVPGAPERRMRRSRTDRMLAGVCGGIAEYTGIDPVLVRLAFLTSLLFGGIGILFYLAAVLIMPKPLP